MKYNRPWENYDEYVDAQTNTNKRKLERVWISEREIDSIVEWIKNSDMEVESGVCHGVRNGFEVERFRNLLEADIIGTEISETASRFANVLQWDFHDIKEGWVGKFDFIYSNSIDHSYDFRYCLNQWMRTLKKGGACFIEWSYGCTDAYFALNSADCLSIEKEELENLLNERNRVIDSFKVLDKNGMPNRTIFVVQHKENI